jgi:hypothetical protein
MRRQRWVRRLAWCTPWCMAQHKVAHHHTQYDRIAAVKLAAMAAYPSFFN